MGRIRTGRARWLAGALASVLVIATPAHAAGELDPSFGEGRGYVLTSFTPGSGAYLGGGFSLPDGGLIATGLDDVLDSRIAIARYRADGSLNPSFGGDGKVTIETPITDPWVTTDPVGARGPGGSVLVGAIYTSAGFFCTESPTFAYLVTARLLPDGSLDTTYGDRGLATAAMSPVVNCGIGVTTLFGWTVGVHFGADGSASATVWVAAGPTCPFRIWPCAPSFLASTRLTPQGTVDTSFGLNGVAVVHTPEAASYGHSALTREGEIFTIGGTGRDLAIRKLTSDGLPDTQFGTAGVLLVDDGGVDHGHRIALADDGAVLFAGSAGPPPLGDRPSFSYVARMDPTGRIDKAFGAEGRAATPFDIEALTPAGGDILVAGGSTPGKQAARMDEDGHVLWVTPKLPLDTSNMSFVADAGDAAYAGATAFDPSTTSRFVLYRITS